MVNKTAAMAVASAELGGVLPLASLNHISIVCRSVEKSLNFYMNVLGFNPIRRPGSFDFSGAWLFNYGIGIHLLQAEEPDSLPEKTEINPKDNHISFQNTRRIERKEQKNCIRYMECESMVAVERRLKELGIQYVRRCVEEGDIYVDQIFFHDPDGFMIEICNCDNLPVVPLADQPAAMGACKRAVVVQQQQQPSAPAAATTQCVPSSNAIQRVGEEAHISCA